MTDINRITGHWESRVIDVSEQNITVGDLIQDEDYDCIEWRVTTPENWDEPDMLFGCCKSVNGELISLDGDTYSKSEIVVRYQKYRGGDVENGLTVVVEAQWYSGSELNEYLEKHRQELKNKGDNV